MLLHIRGANLPLPQNNEPHIRISLMGPEERRDRRCPLMLESTCRGVTSCYANQNLLNKMAATVQQHTRSAFGGFEPQRREHARAKRKTGVREREREINYSTKDVACINHK